MVRKQRLIAALVLCLISAVTVFFVMDVYVLDRVPRGVSLAGVIDLGGLSVDQAVDHIQAMRNERPETLDMFIEDIDTSALQSVSIEALEINIDSPELLVAEAIAQRSDGNVWDQFVDWVRGLLGEETLIYPTLHIVRESMDIWLAHEGSILRNYTDIQLLKRNLESGLVTQFFSERALPIVIRPDLEPAGLPEYFVLSSDRGDERVLLDMYHLAGLGVLEGTQNVVNPDHFALLTDWFAARDAELVIGEDEFVQIAPSASGLLIDEEATRRSIETALSYGEPWATLAVTDVIQPVTYTEDLERLDIQHLVSSFTTYHSPRGARVHNIQLLADILDGTIVMPGERFSLNEAVGPRTTEKGFREAGMIFKGELINSVGGGISQFATTFYNAVFWGGYNDIAHKPHSWYFSRYPEGIEATVSWPDVHLVFENDSESAILVKTSHTPSSITVKFYSNNDGRMVVGHHRSGKSTVDVVHEGGPLARRVTGSTSGRTNVVQPSVRYISDPTVAPFQLAEGGGGYAGWKMRVYRTVETPQMLRDGTIEIDEKSESWPVQYLPWHHEVHVNPCHFVSKTYANLEACNGLKMVDASQGGIDS